MATVEKLTELIKSGNTAELRVLLENDPKLIEQKTGGVSLLQFAAYCGNENAIAILRAFKPRLDEFEAAALGDLNQLKRLLIQDNAALIAFSADGFTLLGLACFFGHQEMVNYLIGEGADPNIPSANPFRVTPLHSACAISHFEIAGSLINAGADVNAKQSHGVTPLHSAAHNGQPKLAGLLINNGADVNAMTDAGQSPLQMALEKNHNETADVIRSRGGVLN